MALREVDAISDAIIATEKEIADGAWGQEQNETGEADGDRSLEDMGEGLEGQHEPDEDDEAGGEDADGETESEGEGEAVAAEAAAAAEAERTRPAEKTGEGEQPKPVTTEQPKGIPPVKHRELGERARAAEAERDALMAAREKDQAETKAKFDLLMQEIAALKTAPRGDVKPPEPAKPVVVPDIFEDPKGFVEHITNGFKSELSARDAQIANARVETSMAIAHAFHKDTFEKAWEAVNKLNPNDPDGRATVQRIYNSPNPGEALVSWHKRNETFARVGSDPAAYEERIKTETREALMKDPEFRKAIIAELRGDAARGDNGQPRTTTRVPPSLHRAAGSNIGADRGNQQYDDSDSAVAEAAWR